nr:restriction endonuclease subunit S [Stutzerimonas stutzeri]
MVKLSTVCTLINGRAYAKDELLSEGKYEVLRVGNFFSNRDWYYSDLELPEDKYCDHGDLLYAWSASFGPRIWGGKKVIYHYHIWKIVIDEGVVDKKYLFYALQNDVESIKREQGTGSTMIHVTKSAMEDRLIPLPPLPEQKRIAAILVKADAIRRKRQQAIQLADDFLRAVFLDMFGDPVTNPKGWKVVELSTLVDPDDKLNYGVVQPGDDEEDGVPLVRSGDLSDVTPNVNQLRRVSASIDSKHRKSKLKGNEILIACVGTIGRVGWVSDAMIGWNIARAVTRIPIREGVNREYVYRYLQNPVVQGYFVRETRAVAQPTLNVGLIAKTPVALPPHDLQIAFLERYRTIQAYKERLLVALGAQDELAGCLSQRAFAGQL